MICKLYAAITASADNVASTTIPRKGRLTGVLIDLSCVGTADGAQCDVEVSLQSRSTLAVSDVWNGPLASLSSEFDITTSGEVQTGRSQFIACNELLEAGSKIYIHATETGSQAWRVCVYLYFDATR